jgi:hypothetical protein
MQQDMPEDEARALLRAPLICDDPGDWVMDPSIAFTERIQCGLLSEQGERRGLLLDFRFTGHRRIHRDRYMFTVYKLDRGRHLRVYQLDIQKWPRLPNDRHAWPHEHIGNTRVVGDATWLNWSFDDMLDRFCQTTNVSFQPVKPNDPTHFTLKRS